MDLSSTVVELLLDNDLTAYETAADFKSGKPVASADLLLNKCRVLKYNTIKNALSNVAFFSERGNNLLELQSILKARKASSKAFFSKFDLVNPFKMWIIYGRSFSRRLPQTEPGPARVATRAAFGVHPRLPHRPVLEQPAILHVQLGLPPALRRGVRQTQDEQLCPVRSPGSLSSRTT